MDQKVDHLPTERYDSPTSLSEPVSSGQSLSILPSTRRKKFPRTSFAYRIREHVKLGTKLSETVKGKLSVIKKGGREKIFKDIFGMKEGERLLKASQCYLSTTAGPIAGNLFISSEKIGFLSERSINVHSSSGDIITTPYKLIIPLMKIKGAKESENINNPSQKYIVVVTDDDFEFWFMGFVRYEKAFINLQRALFSVNSP